MIKSVFEKIEAINRENGMTILIVGHIIRRFRRFSQICRRAGRAGPADQIAVAFESAVADQDATPDGGFDIAGEGGVSPPSGNLRQSA